MDLREYWQIVWRRRRIVMPLVLVTFIASAIVNLILPPTFKTDTTIHVQALMPPPVANPYVPQEYYRTVHSEYLTDDLGVIIKTRAFAEKVQAELQSRYGRDTSMRDILDAITTTKKLHRTLKITIATGDQALTKQLGDSVDAVLSREGGRMVTAQDYDLINVSVIDPPRDPTSPNVARRLLDVLLHSAVAAVVGTGLAFLLHSLDDRVRDESDAAETVGWPVLGAIPGDSTEDTGALPAGVRAALERITRPFRQPVPGARARAARPLHGAAARRPAARGPVPVPRRRP
jgi:capsular polysaccharide biosynthesis protein